jgi:hypothetical protein
MGILNSTERDHLDKLHSQMMVAADSIAKVLEEEMNETTDLVPITLMMFIEVNKMNDLQRVLGSMIKENNDISKGLKN